MKWTFARTHYPDAETVQNMKYHEYLELEHKEEEALEHARIIAIFICFIPMSILLFIELNQIYINHMQYIKEGWNLVDLSSITVFFIFSICRISNAISDKDFSTTCLKMLIMIFGFLKLLFFFRVFRKLGFLIQMLR